MVSVSRWTTTATLAEPAPDAPEGQGRRHVVGPDDTLIELARQYYNEALKWPKIWYANRHKLSEPKRLVPGMWLLIPPNGPLTEEERTVLDQKEIPDIP